MQPSPRKLRDLPSLNLVITRCRRLLRSEPARTKAELREYTSTCRPDGTWPDIDYASQRRGQWEPGLHLQRIGWLSRAVTDKEHPLFQDRRILDTIFRSLDYWCEVRPLNSNWWYNEIGIPRLMRTVIILLGRLLNGSRRIAALEVLRQYDAWHPWTIGANLVWTADLGLHYGCLVGDAALVAKMSKKIAHEIVIGNEEGMQPDFSFLQHGRRLQQFSYGLAFLEESVRIAWELRGTPWAFPQTKRTLLSRHVLEGCQWMSRGIHTVPGTLDRTVSRSNSLRNADLRRILPLLAQADASHARALRQMLRRQEGKNNRFVGYRHFPKADFTAYHQPQFSFFLKTVSSRTETSESINDENLRGTLMNCGDAYLMADGVEYHNLQPVWDWSLLPGITSAPDMGTVVRQPFVGSVDNGASGLTVMDYHFGNRRKGLSLRKVWAAHSGVIICLISGLKGNGLPPPRTVLDQCLLRGPVTVGVAENRQINVPRGETRLTDVRWIHHGNFAYLFPELTTIVIRSGDALGSWQQINANEPTEVIERPVFLPMLEHHPGACSYALAYTPSASATETLWHRPTWHVLRNDTNCQSVRFSDETTMAAFYQRGILKEASRPLISVGQPCLILADKNQLWASDPSHHGGPAIIDWRGAKSSKVVLPADGTSRIAKSFK
jgi:chondroitin AC lyase